MIKLADLIRLNKPVALASQSPRRKKLLEQIGLEFEVLPSGVHEAPYDGGETHADYAMRLALEKAREISLRKPSHIIIGADTIVLLNGELLGKPEHETEAREMLGKLSGKTHTVITGIAVIDDGVETTDYRETLVTFRELTAEEIKLYVAGGSPMDKAGAYGIQDDFGAVFVNRIEGCYYNIVGLPLEALYARLAKLSEARAQ
ncbi:MAG: Maf family protein [Chloroflexota bacterium]